VTLFEDDARLTPCPFCAGTPDADCDICCGQGTVTREQIGEAMLTGRRVIFWGRQDTIRRPADELVDEGVAAILADQTLEALRPTLEGAYLAMVRRWGKTQLLVRMGLHHGEAPEQEPGEPLALYPAGWTEEKWAERIATQSPEQFRAQYELTPLPPDEPEEG